jgi:tripartite-type tricarboxylate transporter receptor subunit TctC
MRIGQACAWLACVAAAVLAQPAPADEPSEFPVRPVRLVVPFPPGGGADIAARLVAERWSAKLRQPIVVENRSGASGNLGMDAVAKARPDGYTLGLNSLPLAINPSLHRAMPFDTLKDLVPVGTVATTSLVVVVHPSVKAGSVRELVALARAQPGRLTLAETHVGAGQLSVGLLKELGEPQFATVQYRGEGPALAELVGGQVDVALVAVPAALPHIRAGRLRPLATVGTERDLQLPGVPALPAADLHAPVFPTWFVVVAPAGTPAPVVAALNRTLDDTLREPDLIDRMARNGLEPWVSSLEEANAFVRSELDRWGALIRSRVPGTG